MDFLRRPQKGLFVFLNGTVGNLSADQIRSDQSLPYLSARRTDKLSPPSTEQEPSWERWETGKWNTRSSRIHSRDVRSAELLFGFGCG